MKKFLQIIVVIVAAMSVMLVWCSGCTTDTTDTVTTIDTKGRPNDPSKGTGNSTSTEVEVEGSSSTGTVYTPDMFTSPEIKYQSFEDFVRNIDVLDEETSKELYEMLPEVEEAEPYLTEYEWKVKCCYDSNNLQVYVFLNSEGLIGTVVKNHILTTQYVPVYMSDHEIKIMHVEKGWMYTVSEDGRIEMEEVK